MDYSEYLKLGFKRVELDDSIEFDKTGHNGFYLERKLWDGLIIIADSGRLNEPYLSTFDEDNFVNVSKPIECNIVKNIVETFDICFKTK